MRPGSVVRLLLWTVLATAYTMAPSPVGAQRAAWDQERVTALAQELVTKAGAMQDAIRKGPQSTFGSGQEASFYRLKQDIRRARTEARQLAGELEDGHGFVETLPVYEDLMTLSRNVAENARRIFMPEPTLAAITSVGEVLNRITPYYADEPPRED